jgi:hypothetical protein
MAVSKKISDLEPATTLTGVELVPIVQGDQTVRTTVNDFAIYATTTLDADVSALEVRVSSLETNVAAVSVLTTFTQVGTGAVKRAGQDKMREMVSPRDFGAAADGVTNDQAAIQNAVNSGAKIVDGQGLTYKVNSRIILPSNITIQNFNFDMTSLPDSGSSTALYFGLQANGTQGTALNLTVDAVAGFGPNPSISLSLADAATLTAGDLIFVTSDQIWADSIRIGELAEVLYVDGTTVYLQSPLTYSYAVADVGRVQKVNVVENITVRNCTVVGPSGLTTTPLVRNGFFGVQNARNIVVENCQIRNFQRSGVEFRRVFQGWMRSCVVKNIIDYYGCSVFDASSYVTVTDNVFENTRHAVSLVSSTTVGGINNYIVVTGNYCTGRDASLDTHVSSDNVIFANNVCRGEGKLSAPSGIIFQGRNAVITGNTINGNLNNGVIVQPFVELAGYEGIVVVSNNLVDVQRNNIAANGIYYQASNSATRLPLKGIAISGNIINGADGFGVYIQNTNAAVSPANNISVNGNTILDCAIGVGFRTDTVAGTISNISVTGNTITTTQANAEGIVFRPNGAGNLISNANITGNTFTLGASSIGVDVLGSGTCSGITIANNNYSNVTTPIDTTFQLQTIASGVVTLTSYFNLVRIDTEGAAASDDLDTINGGQFGQVTTFAANNTARTVVFKDGTGNLRLAGDFSLDNSEDSITCIFNGSAWLEIARSDNGA